MTCAWAAMVAPTTTTGAHRSRPDITGRAAARVALNHRSPIHGVQSGLKSNCGSAQQSATTPAAATSRALGPLQDPAAAWGLLDTDANELTYRRVPYDIDKAAAKIRAAGLPAALWKRLNAGK